MFILYFLPCTTDTFIMIACKKFYFERKQSQTVLPLTGVFRIHHVTRLNSTSVKGLLAI